MRKATATGILRRCAGARGIDNVCIDNVCKNKELKLGRFTRFHGLAGFALVTIFIFQKP